MYNFSPSFPSADFVCLKAYLPTNLSLMNIENMGIDLCFKEIYMYMNVSHRSPSCIHLPIKYRGFLPGSQL